MGDFIQKYRRQVAVAAVLLTAALIAAGYRLYLSGAERPAAEQCAAATAAEVAPAKPERLVREGRVELSAGVAVTCGVSGRVGEVYVAAGQTVKAGQPLFKVEPAGGGGASAGTAAKQRSGAPPADYESALKEYNRCQKLYEQGAIPRRQLENAAAQLKALQEGTDGGGQAASASGGLTAPVTVTAPVGGVVTGLAIAAGSAVQGNQQALVLGGGQALEVTVALAREELYLAGLGTEVVIEAAGQTFAGQVAAIYPEVQENKISCFRTHIKPVNPPAGLLQPGMAVTVLIDAGK